MCYNLDNKVKERGEQSLAYKKLVKYGLIGGCIGLTLMMGTFLSPSIGANPEDDKIHFINTGNSDAILLESNSRFALIDTGENDEGDVNAYEKVVEYLNKIKKDSSDKFSLELVVATHPNKKALGGLDELLKNENIRVENIILENYDESKKRVRDLEKNENLNAYYDLVNTIAEKNINRITTPSDETNMFGDFEINYINTLAKKEELTYAKEANSSMGIIVKKDDMKVFLAGGINNLSNDEDRLASLIGDVDLIKLAKQGNKISSTENFLKLTKPEHAVLTGTRDSLHPNIYKNIKNLQGKVYSTVENDGIVATFTEDGLKLNKNTEVANGWYNEFENTFYYDEKGNLLTGWQNIAGNTYYFYEDGTLHRGWLDVADGNKMYMHGDGSMAKGITQIENSEGVKTYHFDENGIMSRGWVNVDNLYYYLNENPEDINYGSAVTGILDIWYQDTYRKFKFDDNGVMQVGMIQEGDSYYYFNDSPERGVLGEALVGSHFLNVNGVDNTYTFGDDGILLYVE